MRVANCGLSTLCDFLRECCCNQYCQLGLMFLSLLFPSPQVLFNIFLSLVLTRSLALVCGIVVVVVYYYCS